MTIRYRAGWLIPQQVLALTHFVPDVSMEDFMGIQADSAQAIETIQGSTSLIIDNRMIQNTDLAPLSQMLQAMPHINHPQLNHIVMIVPQALADSAATIPDQTVGHITLTHVASLDAAYDHLKSINPELDWVRLDQNFFQNLN